LAIELPGRWGPELAKFFDNVKRQAAELHQLDSIERSLFAAHWKQSLAVGFMREVCRAALSMREHLFYPTRSSASIDLGFA
jgi:hypothetical protein